MFEGMSQLCEINVPHLFVLCIAIPASRRNEKPGTHLTCVRAVRT